MYCPKCGTQLPDDSVFCSSCGAQIGAPAGSASSGASTAASNAAAAAAANAAAARAAARAATQSSVSFLKDYMQNPAAAAKTLLDQHSLTVPLILLVIQAIVGGLVLFSFLSGVCNTIKDLIFSFMGMTSLSSYSSIPKIGPSFFMSLLFGILIAVVAILVFAALLFALCKLTGVTCGFQDVLIVCGAHSTFVTVLLLISFLLFFLNLNLGLLFFVGALLAWAITGVLSVQSLTTDSSAKTWILYIVVALITVVIGYFVATKAMGGAVKAISISVMGESHTIGEAMEMAGMGNFEDMFSAILKELN